MKETRETIEKQRKKLLEQLRRLPYLRVKEDTLYLDFFYYGEEMFRLVKNIFFNKVFYGGFNIGGPFIVGAYIRNNGWTIAELELSNRTETIYHTRKDYEADDEKFWFEFRKKNWLICQIAKRMFWKNLWKLNIIDCYRDFYMLLGSMKNFLTGGNKNL